MSDGTRQIDLTQIKTKEKLYLPLSENALKVMPERGKSKDADTVFRLPKRCMIQKYLRTVPGVASAKDESIQLGGSGVTVVTFD